MNKSFPGGLLGFLKRIICKWQIRLRISGKAGIIETYI